MSEPTHVFSGRDYVSGDTPHALKDIPAIIVGTMNELGLKRFFRDEPMLLERNTVLVRIPLSPDELAQYLLESDIDQEPVQELPTVYHLLNHYPGAYRRLLRHGLTPDDYIVLAHTTELRKINAGDQTRLASVQQMHDRLAVAP